MRSFQPPEVFKVRRLSSLVISSIMSFCARPQFARRLAVFLLQLAQSAQALFERARSCGSASSGVRTRRSENASSKTVARIVQGGSNFRKSRIGGREFLAPRKDPGTSGPMTGIVSEYSESTLSCTIRSAWRRCAGVNSL